MKRITILLSSILLLSLACKKPKTFDGDKKGELTVEFDNIVGDEQLNLNTSSYTNNSGEQFKITKLKYYVSNFELTKADGSTFTVPQDSSYFLIDESEVGEHLATLQVPEGEYTSIKFMVGVDSLRNTMDIAQRTGVLDPTAAGGDMYWSWNSGYIFFKMEGTSPASTQTDNIFQYHIGGFGGYSSPTINNIKTVTINLRDRGVAQVKATKETNIHLTVDVMKIFNGAIPLSIATNSTVMAANQTSANIANNYATMFSHDHTEN